MTVVGCFEFGGWDVAAVFVEAAVVVPVDPFQHGDFDLLGGPPGAAGFEQFGLEQPDRGFGQCVVERVTDGADRGQCPGGGEAFGAGQSAERTQAA